MNKQSLVAVALGLVALTSVVSQSAEARNHNGWGQGQSCASGNGSGNGFGTTFNTSLGANAGCNQLGAYNNNQFGAYNNNPVYTNQAYGFNRGWGNGLNNRFGNIDARQNQIASQIQRGISSGRISQSEANRLLSQQQRINDLEARFRVNGLSLTERARLQAQLSKLSAQMHYDMNNQRLF
jgi:hypothetical protein